MTTEVRETYVRVGAVEDFQPNVFRIFDIAGRSVGVVRTDNGFFAVRNRCPHQGSEICRGRVTGTMLPSRPFQYEYTDERPILMCPWHRWEFDLITGTSVQNVAKHRLVTHDVRITGDEVRVSSRPQGSGDRV